MTVVQAAATNRSIREEGKQRKEGNCERCHRAQHLLIINHSLTMKQSLALNHHSLTLTTA